MIRVRALFASRWLSFVRYFFTINFKKWEETHLLGEDKGLALKESGSCRCRLRLLLES